METLVNILQTGVLNGFLILFSFNVIRDKFFNLHKLCDNTRKTIECKRVYLIQK